MRGIADTGFLVAFLNRKDRFHPWALEIAREAEVPLLTCEPVLAEAAYHVRSSSHVLALVDLCLICLSEDFPHHEVVTVDSDFLIYRRWEREVIPTRRPM